VAKPRRIIEVEWQDHSFSFGRFNPLDSTVSSVITAGYYVGEDERVIHVALSISEDQFNDVQTVDKRMVSRRRYIR
jgi:hypothetical protein